MISDSAIRNFEWNKSSTQALVAIRDPLVAFARQVLLEGRPPDLEHLQPAVLPLAFDDDMWWSSALFKPIPSWKVDPRGHEIWGAITRWTREKYLERFDKQVQDTHKERERIGADWALLSLSAFAADRELMHLLYLGAQAYLMRAFPLRIIAIGDFPTDWTGALRAPKEHWRISSLCIFYLYAMFLIYLIGNQTLTRKLALPPGVGEFAEGLEEQINAMQRHVRWTVQRIAFLIAQNHAHLTAGDLIVADGLISVLIANSTAQWRDFEAMLRVSPLTRLLGAERLAKFAGDPTLVAHLRPRRFVTDWEDSGLLQLAQAGHMPGMHFRLAQCLADACRPNFHPLLFEEMASAVEWLNDAIVLNLCEREKDLGTELCFPTEDEFWVGALVTRAVSLVERDGFLQSLKARSATGGFLKPFNTDGLVDLLYRSLRDHPHLQEHRLKGSCYQYIKDEKERLDSKIGW